MICKVCGNKLMRGAVQCDRCTALVSNMRDVPEKDMDHIPGRWLICFAVIPNLINTLTIVCLFSEEWIDLWLFFAVVSFLAKVVFFALDRREFIRRDREVKNWTFIGIVCAPVYILFRDRISATAIVSFILWLICLLISFFVFCIV